MKTPPTPREIIVVRIGLNSGTFETGMMQESGWAAANAVLKAFLGLLGTREPQKIEPIRVDLANRAKPNHHRTVLELRCSIPAVDPASLCWTAREMSLNCTPKSIAGIGDKDPRLILLRELNHALAETCFRAEVVIHGSEVVLQGLARVPFCRRDEPWAGSEIARASNWSRDHKQISGSSLRSGRVTADLMGLPTRFDELWSQHPAYIKIFGCGYINAAGLRITDVHRIEAVEEDENIMQRPLRFDGQATAATTRSISATPTVGSSLEGPHEIPTQLGATSGRVDSTKEFIHSERHVASPSIAICAARFGEDD